MSKGGAIVFSVQFYQESEYRQLDSRVYPSLVILMLMFDAHVRVRLVAAVALAVTSSAISMG